MSKAEISENENIAQLSSLDQQWLNCCRSFAEFAVPAIDDMLPDPFNEQKRLNQVKELSAEVSSNELIDLLCIGFQQLAESQIEEQKQLLVELVKKINNLDMKTNAPIPNNLAAQLQIDSSLLAILENYGLKELAEGKMSTASPLFAISAFLQNQRAEIWFHLAFALYQEERFHLACNAALTAYTLQPQQPEYSLLLAACYAVLNQNDQAREALNNAEQLLADFQLTLSSEWEQLQKKTHERL